LDTAAQNYRLTVTSPELSLQDVVLQTQGDLIPEGGDGVIRVGQAQGFQIGSDYHADWTRMEVGGQPHGVARVDMQGLYPLLQSAAVARAMGSPGPTQASADYDHRWFAVAGQADGQAVWISAWRIEAPGGPFWDVTIARANGQDWQVASTTEQSAAVEALTIRELAWQALPPTAGEGALRAGAAWRITAGVLRPGDLLDLEIAVPPGQFATSARFGTLGGLTWMEEAVGVTAFGMVGRQALSDVTLAVAESTAEFYVGYLPLVRR
jgi:hypothetical protein